MTRVLSIVAFILGALVVVWMGMAFMDSNLLALAVTLVIGAVFVVGLVELLHYQQLTRTLCSALSEVEGNINSLDDWIRAVPTSLRNPVRQRIEGEHVGLPSPVLAPYLIGLLVMLGLLGTFAGMVDTLKGAVMALEGTTELEAIRAGLAAPIKGLSMAFGTSVAGIAASAMLGFISTLSRRERMQASRLLDEKVGTAFQQLSLSHNRQQTYKAMQAQAQALPDMAQQLTLLTEQLGRMSEDLSTRLLDNQERFHHTVTQAYSDLASSVDDSLRENLAASGRLAGESIAPVVRQMADDINRSVEATHQSLLATSEQQLQSMTQLLETSSAGIAGAWKVGVAEQERANEKLAERIGSSLEGFSRQFEQGAAALLDSFGRASNDWLQRQQLADEDKMKQWSQALDKSSSSLQQTAADLSRGAQVASESMIEKISSLLDSTETLVEARVKAEADWLSGHSQRMQELAEVLKLELSQLRDAEAVRGENAAAQLKELQAMAAQQLAELGQGLEEPMKNLIATASETPKAAAEVIAKLRQEVGKNAQRDNEMLSERKLILEQISELSKALAQASSGQSQAVENLVDSSAELLQTAAGRFTQFVEAETVKLADVVESFTVSATELSSLGEAFNAGVQGFADANKELIDTLSSIEESLEKSGVRSDEQLAYYVAQAREIIDHSMLSQQELLQQLRQLPAAAV